MNVVIVNTGGANLASLNYALQRLGVTATISSDHACIADASHVLLPGVGAADDTMNRLRSTRLDTLVRSLQQPVLGICLGMQILAEQSEERDAACLGLLPGVAEALRPAVGRPVPHMGWNQVAHDGTGLFEGVANDAYFYFVHSYALPVSATTTAKTNYGTPFSAAVRRGNCYGTQFHPERSGVDGARVLANFLALEADDTEH